MFYGQCWKCGERWELGTASACKCPDEEPVKFAFRENNDSTEILRVTPEGEFIWHEDADRMIEEGDFSQSPALPHILKVLRKQRHEQEPVGQLLEDAFGRGQVMWFNKPKDESMLYTAPPQRTKQEPVAWGVFEGNLHDMFFTQVEAVEMAHLKGTHAEVKPLYTTPPQRTWVDLTRKQMAEVLCDDRWQGRPELMLLRAQQLFKEKNTRGQK